jgi:hypothetical protein
MNRDTKKNLKIIGDIYPELVQLQVEDYCPEDYRVVVINSSELTEKDKEE